MPQAQLQLYSRGVVLVDDLRLYTQRVYVDPSDAFEAARRLSAFLNPDGLRFTRCAVEAASDADGAVVS